jgi:GT2 family glycosyltransferase
MPTGRGENTRLSVVVPTRDRPDQLDGCLAALTRSLRPDDELVVVDSASRDPRVADVARRHGATVVRCERAGTSRARNAGVRRARHDIVAFVDDDVRVDPEWADALAAAFHDDDISFVTGRVAVPEHQRGVQRPVAVKDDPTAARLDREAPSPLGASANLAVRRAVLDAVGGFDESLGGGARFQSAEDVDLFDRLLAGGWTGRYEPAARAEHEQWRDRRSLLRLDWRYGLGVGARLAKLVRTDRARARKAAREALWGDGVRVLLQALRARHEFEIATTTCRLVGAVAGFAWGVVTPVRDGWFAPR